MVFVKNKKSDEVESGIEEVVKVACPIINKEISRDGCIDTGTAYQSWQMVVPTSVAKPMAEIMLKLDENKIPVAIMCPYYNSQRCEHDDNKDSKCTYVKWNEIK